MRPGELEQAPDLGKQRGADAARKARLLGEAQESSPPRVADGHEREVHVRALAAREVRGPRRELRSQRRGRLGAEVDLEEELMVPPGRVEHRQEVGDDSGRAQLIVPHEFALEEHIHLAPGVRALPQDGRHEDVPDGDAVGELRDAGHSDEPWRALRKEPGLLETVERERRGEVDVLSVERAGLQVGTHEAVVQQSAQSTLRAPAGGEVQPLELPSREVARPGEAREHLDVALRSHDAARPAVRARALPLGRGHHDLHGKRIATPQTRHGVQPAPAPQTSQRPTQPWYSPPQRPQANRPRMSFACPFGQTSRSARAATSLRADRNGAVSARSAMTSP